MKYNRMQLCGSISSTNVVTQMHVAHGAGISKETTEFVNYGKLITGMNGYAQIIVIVQRNHVTVALIWLWFLLCFLPYLSPFAQKWVVGGWLFNTVVVLAFLSQFSIDC